RAPRGSRRRWLCRGRAGWWWRSRSSPEPRDSQRPPAAPPPPPSWWSPRRRTRSPGALHPRASRAPRRARRARVCAAGRRWRRPLFPQVVRTRCRSGQYHRAMPGPVLLDLEDGIARLRLNRPEASNALNRELLEALAEAVRSLQRERSLRAVLLSGEGENFCAGGDVREFASKGDSLPDHLREMTALLGFIANGLVHLHAAVLSVVQGAATGGGGLGLVCATDFVLAGPRARFMLGATRVGMAPDAGISMTLTRLVGLRQALRIALTNEMLDAEEARSIGLVTQVVDDEHALYETALALARDLAANAP